MQDTNFLSHNFSIYSSQFPQIICVNSKYCRLGDVMIEKSHPQGHLSLKPVKKRVLILTVLAGLALSAVPIVTFLRYKESSQVAPTPTPTVPAEEVVSALGRLSPQGEAIKLSAPASLQSARVDKLLVQKEGDLVQAGQVVAILDNRDRLYAAVETAKKQVQVAQANLAKVKSGAKQGEIEAQKAEIARLKAQLLREKTAQAATIARYQAQLLRETTAQAATVERIYAQLQGDREAQSATIARLEAELNNAASEFKRNQQLYQEGGISASVLDSKRMMLQTAQAKVDEANANLKRISETGKAQLNEANANLYQTRETLQEQIKEENANLKRIEETLQEQIKQAQATLDKIAEVRPTDVKEAQAKVEEAIATLKQAEAELDLAYVKSPINGHVLKIHTRAGEAVGKEGIVELGQTAHMHVVAEVYENDIGKIQIGQTATITSSNFAGGLQGNVIEKGWKIAKKDVLDTDPASDVDARVVEVRIQLNSEDSKKVAGLTNLQVDVKIKVNPG
jgi:HlyD family secretion protein